MFTVCVGGNILSTKDPSLCISVHRVPGKGTFLARVCGAGVQIWHSPALCDARWEEIGSFPHPNELDDSIRIRDVHWHSRDDEDSAGDCEWRIVHRWKPVSRDGWAEMRQTNTGMLA